MVASAGDAGQACTACNTCALRFRIVTHSDRYCTCITSHMMSMQQLHRLSYDFYAAVLMLLCASLV
jgi:hypothetical protein